MAQPIQLDVARLAAIDVHVHLESDSASVADTAARQYFGESGAPRDRQGFADYYRSRNMACVVFTVDEHLTGRKQPSNDEVVRFAADNPDVALAFASIDPTRGPEAVREARRLLATGYVRGLKLHPPAQQFFPNDRVAYPLYEVFAEARLPVLFHTGHSGIGTGVPGGAGIRLKYGNPMPIDDVAVDFPELPIVMAHPSFPVAGRSHLDLPAQAHRVHRPVGMVAEVLPADPGAAREHAAQAQGALRFRLPVDHAGPVAEGLRADRDS